MLVSPTTEFETEQTAVHAALATNVLGLVSVLDRQPTEGGVDPVFGNVTWQTLISGDKTNSSGMVLGVATFPAFGVLNLHQHTQTEFYFCLSGAGTVMLDGQSVPVSPGVSIFIPSNVEHGVTAGPQGLRFVYGFDADAFSEIDYRFSASVKAELPFS